MSTTFGATGDVEAGIFGNVWRKRLRQRACVGIRLGAARSAAAGDNPQDRIFRARYESLALGHLIHPLRQDHAPRRHAQCARAIAEISKRGTGQLPERQAEHRALRI